MTDPALVSRRALMLSGLVAGSVLTGACGSRRNRPVPAAGAGEDADPDVVLLTAAIQDEAALLGLALATMRRHRRLDRVVGPMVARQRAHVRAMSAGLSEPPSVQRQRPGRVPRTPAKALAAVGEAAADAEAARLDDCLAASSGLLARLLASVSASHAATVETVRRAR